MDNVNILLGTRKGLLVYQYHHNKWHLRDVFFEGIPVTLAHFDPIKKTWWALLDHGHWGCKVHRSMNGKDWEELPAPIYPENAFAKEGVRASTRLLWAFASDPSSDAIWMGTEPGGLFKSESNGRDFILNQALWNHPSRMEHWFGGGRDYAAIHSILLHPDNPNNILVGISCAGVFESTDAGLHWRPINNGLKADFLPNPNAEVGQDPHLLVRCQAKPDVLWQQNHCGIFRSTNGGRNWEEVSETNGPAKFGFAIAADAEDPDVAFVVPAVSDENRIAVGKELIVCRTRDGGKTWDRLQNGLPKGPSFDIVYRHALDLNREWVAFGTTTGNVYVSSNSGEEWTCLSNHLPMVNSLEFFDAN